MELLSFQFDVPGDDFSRAGEASSAVKRSLKQLGVDADSIRRVAIAMYEGEINMVIHAGGGTVQVQVTPQEVLMTLEDRGPGIPDVEKAMQAGFSTASDSVRSLGFGAGMGLPNMKKYTDRMAIHTQLGVGTRVEMAVLLPQKEESPC